MEQIYNEFIFWLYGLIEDDPIPYEIKSLVFFVNKNNEIGFSGAEEKEINKIDYYFYFPLESQFFYCPKIYKKKNVLEILKKMLEKLKLDSYFCKFNLYYGNLFSFAKKI